ncbi:hypothetical protein [Eikenella sp. Marseille-P7795]|uniref:hypothetical protein n=1 Tax=Eikenella sp. Marseille-P7795 TaxID=2866577 RepID=UPI001CE47698|nr:hypothetical protein [Eikenella sp. Marseille-P7795]
MAKILVISAHQNVGRWLFLHWDDRRQKTAGNFTGCGFERSWCKKKLAPAFALD